jgi:FAD/FMN-containing dehydrogenase
LPEVHVAALRRAVQGEVLLPADTSFHAARTVWNAMVDRRPALIARCTRTADVVAALRFADAAGLEVGVHGGGHSVRGLCVPDGGLMIDLSTMSAVRLDPERRRARVQGGALLSVLDRATQQYGLATTAGIVSHTGVGGLTLGGGMGWLARRLGLACDNVETFELVTADGSVLRASAAENADLFWGLRGGGGNFGVVTEFDFRLHDVGTRALVVDLVYTLDDAPMALRRWRDLAADAPRRATLTAAVGRDAERLSPSSSRGAPLVAVGYVWVGDPDEGRHLAGMLRGPTRPLAERVEEMTYLELQAAEDEVQRHGLRRYRKGYYLRELTDGALDAFMLRGAPADGDGELPDGTLQLYGGAIGDVGDSETAFSHRATLVEFVVSASWTEPVADEAHLATARRYGAAMAPFASGVFNDLPDDRADGAGRVHDPGKLAQLVALKDRYDPRNVFHRNHNIRPSAPGRA